jgi:methionine sulfoxide reductase heme-binding subunit
MAEAAIALSTPPPRSIRWQLPLIVLGTAGSISLIGIALYGMTEEAAAHTTAYTARFSFLLFMLVFSTGALASLFPSSPTAWLRRNRRYFGLAFALAHFLHLGALTTLFAMRGEVPDAVTLLGGGLAYLLVGLMALTSNDQAVRALGLARWQQLHLVGVSYVWLIFMNSYVGRVLSVDEASMTFAALASLGTVGLLLRVAAWRSKRRCAAA